MDDVEYILRIILKARDEMAAVLAKARTQIRGFTKDSDAMTASVDKLNVSMGKFNKNMDGVSKKLEAWRAVLRDAGSDGDKTARSLDNMGKTVDRVTASTQKAVASQKSLQENASKLRQEYKDLDTQLKNGTVTSKYAADGFKRIEREMDALFKKMNLGTRSSQRLHAWVQDVKAASNAIVENERASQRALDDLAKEEIARDKRVQQSKEQILRRRNEQQRQRARLASESARIEREGGDPSEIRRLASEYDKLARTYRIGSARAREFGREAESLRTTVRSMNADTERSENVFNRLQKALSKSHDSAAGFDNQIRGMGILAAVVSIDQLISSAIALGGELVSLAGSAVMAGGALGGALAAGASQALPVLGLLAGAAQRVKSVFEAVTAQQNLQKAQFTDAEKQGQKSIDQANTLANANDSVADANDRLAESRKELTQAQKEGVDQLEDLIYAEKAAALAARGAALDVKGAQEALRLAVREGASQLEIDEKRQALAEARLSQGRAGTTARRARTERRAAGGDVGNLESVKNAAKAVQDAEQAVDKANRGLDQAVDKADRAASSTMTAAANLNFLLSQLSPAERRLYGALQSIYNTYKRIFQGEGTGGSGIYGVIIDSFTRAVEKVEKIMEMPKVISGIQDLANEIGKNIDKVVDAVDPKVVEQLLTIIENAGDNMGPLVDDAIKLAKVFLDLQEDANPAFAKLIEYIGGVVDKIVDLTSNSEKMTDFFLEGEENLEAWLDLVQAVIELLAVLVGASSDEGQKSIEELTEHIKGWTDWLEDHHDQVVGFFKEAHDAAKTIGGVLENIAVVLAKSFSAERVEKFADILNTVVVPALEDFLDFMGKITDIAADLIDNPTVARLARLAIAFLIINKLAGPIIGTFAGIGKSLLFFGEQAFKVGKFFANFGKYVDDLIKLLTTLRPLLIAVFTGPGAIIAAIVGSILFLLIYFDKLDDIWNAIKEGFAGFLTDIQPAIDTLQEALEGMGVHMDSLKDVMKVLQVAGKFLADFIATYLIEEIGGLFKVLAGVAVFVIKTIAAVIEVLHGLADIFIGIFTLDWDQIKKGWGELRKGLYDFVDGIIKGLALALEGLGKIILAPFKAAWNAVKKWFGIDSPSKKAIALGHAIIDGIKEGLVGLARWITAPFRRAWNAVNNFFDGKPQKLAEDIMDNLAARMRILWRRIRNAASFLWEKFKDAFNAAKNFGGTIVNAIVEGVKSLPAALLRAIEDIGGQLVNVGKSIGGKIVEGIKSVAGKVGGFLGIGGDDDDKKPAQGPAKPAAVTAPTFKLDVGAGLIPFGAKDLKDAENIYGKFWQELRRDARNSTDYIQRQFREMRIATTQSSDKMYKDIRGSLRDIQNSFKVRGGAMGENWGDTWDNVNKVAFDGLNYIGSQTNKMLKALSESHINFGLTAPKKEDRGKAGGGFIGKPGQRGRDKGLYALGAGEAVLNWAHQRYIAPAVEAFYGHPFEATFDRVHAYHAGAATDATGFAPGGIVPIPGSPGEFIHKSILKDVVFLRDKYKLHISDGYAPTGHAAGGEHPKGLAIDAGPGPGGSWDIVDQLAAWAEPSQGNPRSPFRWVGYNGDPNHGRGNHIHLSWAAGKTLGAVGDIVTSIAKRMITGPDGGFKTILQSVTEKIRKIANKFIDEKSMTVTAEGAENVPVGKVGAGAGNIFKFFKQHGFTDEQAAAWVGNFQQESGLNPAIVQPNGEGHGLAQWGGGRFAALVAFAKAAGKPWQDMGAQLAFVMHELAGPESAAYRAIKAAKTVLEATNAIGSAYERYGIQGDRSGPAMDAYRKFGGKFDVGGEIPGAEGEPVPILAHAREWVLNPKQQGFLASLIGTGRDTLKAMLGFSGGPFSFQGGGEVKRLTRRVARGSQEYDDLLEKVPEALREVRRVMQAVTKLGPKFKSIAGIVDFATKEGGLLDNLRAAIERRFTAAALRLRRRQYAVGAGRVVRRVQDDIEVAQGAVGQRQSERGDLLRERREIQREFDAVARRQRRAKPGSKLAKDLAARQANLQDRLATSNEAVMQNTEDIFAAQEELARAQEEAAQKRKDDAIKLVDDIKTRYSRALGGNEIFRRMATALGNADWLKQINERQAQLLTDQANELEGRIANLRAVGAGEEADALQDEVTDLRTQVFEMAQQAIKDAADAINTAASRRLGRLDLFGRMADALGVVSNAVGVNVGGETLSRSGVFQQRGQALESQRAGLQGVLGQAAAAGNIGLVQELTDQLAELDVTIAENTKAAREAKFAETQASFDYATRINDLNKQLVESTDAITGQTSTAELLRLAQERLAIYQARGIELQEQLNEAIATGDVKAQQELTAAILENKIAVNQNTKAVNDATGQGSAPVSYTSTAWQWFRSALLTGTGGVMPQYTPPVMGDVNTIGPAGSSTVNGGNTYQTNIEINEAGQPVNVESLASKLVFAQATAQ